MAEDKIIVAVGGTGQKILSLYCQLFVLGIIEEPFRGVIIDSDKTHDDLHYFDNLFKTLHVNENTDLGGGALPTIRKVDIETGGTADQVAQILTGARLEELKTRNILHPASAFFSDDYLRQNLRGGLYARPALVATRDLRRVLANDALSINSSATVVVVGSIIGGTGGGLIAPVINAIIQASMERGAPEPSIRAVLFGRYFNVTKDHGDVGWQFKDTELLALRGIEEGVGNYIKQFVIVGGPDTSTTWGTRDYKEEREGVNQAWPADDSPIWRGLSAVRNMLSDTIAGVPDKFSERECSVPGADGGDSAIDLSPSLESSRSSAAIVDAMVRRNVIRKISRDWNAVSTWGNGLVRLVGYFVSRAVSQGAEKDDFVYELQNKIRIVWEGESNVLGLRKILPLDTKLKHVRVHNIRKLHWPRPSTNLPSGTMNSVDKILNIASTTIIYRAMRSSR
jgi:hypothetical protein